MTAPLLLLAFAAVTLNACAQIVLRKLMLGVGLPPMGGGGLAAYAVALGTSPWFLLGLGCYGVSLGLWMLVLARVEVSLAYPLLSFGYILTAAAGYFLLGESVGPARVAGLALICVGILVISRG